MGHPWPNLGRMGSIGHPRHLIHWALRAIRNGCGAVGRWTALCTSAKNLGRASKKKNEEADSGSIVRERKDGRLQPWLGAACRGSIPRQG